MKPLVLLFGLPRSGTTWIGKIFDSHPGTLYRHEPDSWKRIRFMPLLASAENHKEYCRSSEYYDAGFEGMSLPQLSAKRRYFDKDYFLWQRQTLFRTSTSTSVIIGKILAAEVDTIKSVVINTRPGKPCADIFANLTVV